MSHALVMHYFSLCFVTIEGVIWLLAAGCFHKKDKWCIQVHDDLSATCQTSEQTRDAAALSACFCCRKWT